MELSLSVKFQLLGVFIALSCFTVNALKTSSYCDFCQNHTLCLYDNQTKGAGFVSGHLTISEKIAILKLHNDFRRKIAVGNETRGLDGSQQPPAANMRQMRWDAELATIAQRWADQCTFGHDACRAVSRFPVGQNVFLASWSGNAAVASWDDAFLGWGDEVALFDAGAVGAFEFEPATAHYTQLAWADTLALGCGVAEFVEAPWSNKFFVCNYGPAGNWAGEALYVVGPAGSACPVGTQPVEGLCDYVTDKAADKAAARPDVKKLIAKTKGQSAAKASS